jgi:magnesium transporter
MRFLRPREFAQRLRELARRDPDEAREYLATHSAEWESLAEVDPHDAADILEALEDEDAADLISGLETEEAADVLDEMHPGAAADLIEEMPPAAAARLVGRMEADQAADLIGELDPEARADVVAQLDPAVAAEVIPLLAYAPDSAGGLMTTQSASLPVGMTTGEAFEALRRLQETIENLSYVYIVDDSGRLVGVLSFRELVFARPGVGLDQAMIPNPVRVRTDTDREVVAELIQRYNLFALPVVDSGDRLLGIVKVEEAMAAAQEEATEDIAAMVGAGAEETVYTPLRHSVSKRLPWIVFNLVVGIVLSGVIGLFQDTIEQRATLAALMPMIALVGGNSGAQSLAVVIRAMAVGDLPAQRVPGLLRREITVGLINGLVIATLAALFGGVRVGDYSVALVIFIAAWANLVIAGLAGAGIPVLLRKLGQDPALASNIFLTTVTDIVGFGGFLLTATLLL